MKSTLKQLKKTQAKIVATVEKRDKASQTRSENWQSSKKAQEHEVKTGMLADIYEGVTETIKQLEVYLDEI